MALTLKTAISADQTTIDVEGTDTLREGSYRTLGDETVLIRTARVQGLQPGETAWQRLSVDRGIENTEAVAHDAAVTMATYSGGGGGVTVDPGDGTPVPVTGFVAPGATFVGDTATLTTSTHTVRIIEAMLDYTDVVFPNPGNNLIDVGFPELAVGTWIEDVWIQLLVEFDPDPGIEDVMLYVTVGDGFEHSFPENGWAVGTTTMVENYGQGVRPLDNNNANIGLINGTQETEKSRLGSAALNNVFSAHYGRTLPARVRVAVTPKVVVSTTATSVTTGSARLIIKVLEPSA